MASCEEIEPADQKVTKFNRHGRMDRRVTLSHPAEAKCRQRLPHASWARPSQSRRPTGPVDGGGADLAEPPGQECGVKEFGGFLHLFQPCPRRLRQQTVEVSEGRLQR